MTLNLSLTYWVYIDIIILISILSITAPALRGAILHPAHISFVIILSLLFCLYSLWGGDWIHYKQTVEFVKSVEFEISEVANLEYPYRWIIHNICNNYIIFRSIVWGSALFLCLMTINRIGIYVGIYLFNFALISLMWFSYARVSLALSILLFGFALQFHSYNQRNNKQSLFGIALILLSVYFHKSMIYEITLVFFVLSTYRYKDIILRLNILVCPILLVVILYILDNYTSLFDMNVKILDGIINSASEYLRSRESNKSIVQHIQRIIEIPMYYILAWGCFRELTSRVNNREQIFDAFLYLYLINILVTTLFLFIPHYSFDTIYIRFIRMSNIIASVIISYMFVNNIQSRVVKAVIYTGGFCTVFVMLHSFYSTFFL